jgi:DNA-binding response OmpR family regulator
MSSRSAPHTSHTSTVQPLRPPRVSAHALLAGQRSVLVVEDNPWLGSIIAEALVGEHYKVLQTGSPRVATRLTREYRPDAVVLDLDLPEGTAPELLQRLKSASSPVGPIPVLALSSQAERTPPEVRQAALAVLGKPFDLPELLGELGQAVALRPHVTSAA